MSLLFTPYPVGNLTLANRIVVAPMCMYSAESGCATDWHRMHLGQLAASGAGLVILEATAVTPEGRISPQDLGLWSDECEVALQSVLEGIRAFAPTPMAIQLAHAGRKASSHVPWEGGQLIPPAAGGWETLAPSAIPHAPHEASPTALDATGIARIRDAFGKAAERAGRLGLAAVEIHAAHGYLLHEFLSPLANQRTDQYGSSQANRMRFPLEVFDTVRARFPADRPVGVRLSATDWVDGGWDVPQSIALAKELEKRGCAYLHVSSGGVSPQQQIPVGPGYQLPLAAALREQVTMPIIAVGLITEPAQAEAALVDGHADLIALGRAMLYNPRWPWHAAAALGATVEAPRQYWRSAPSGLNRLFGDTTIGMR